MADQKLPAEVFVEVEWSDGSIVRIREATDPRNYDEDYPLELGCWTADDSPAVDVLESWSQSDEYSGIMSCLHGIYKRRIRNVVRVRRWDVTSDRPEVAGPGSGRPPGDRSEMPLGEVAYSGYFVACGGKSLISGAELPSWDEQSGEIRAAWEAAAGAVRDACRPDAGKAGRA